MMQLLLNINVSHDTSKFNNLFFMCIIFIRFLHYQFLYLCISRVSWEEGGGGVIYEKERMHSL